jgi:hypothetical protein
MEEYTASQRLHMTGLKSIERNVTLFGVRYRLFAFIYCVNENHFGMEESLGMLEASSCF